MIQFLKLIYVKIQISLFILIFQVLQLHVPSNEIIKKNNYIFTSEKSLSKKPICGKL